MAATPSGHPPHQMAVAPTSQVTTTGNDRVQGGTTPRLVTTADRSATWTPSEACRGGVRGSPGSRRTAPTIRALAAASHDEEYSQPRMGRDEVGACRSPRSSSWRTSGFVVGVRSSGRDQPISAARRRERSAHASRRLGALGCGMEHPRSIMGRWWIHGRMGAGRRKRRGDHRRTIHAASIFAAQSIRRRRSIRIAFHPFCQANPFGLHQLVSFRLDSKLCGDHEPSYGAAHGQARKAAPAPSQLRCSGSAALQALAPRQPS